MKKYGESGGWYGGPFPFARAEGDDDMEMAEEDMAMDDAGVFEMISRGDTTGVCQLESSGFEELRKGGVDPKAGEVELRVVRLPQRSAHITGAVVGPDGRPVANASVYPNRAEGRGFFSGH